MFRKLCLAPSARSLQNASLVKRLSTSNRSSLRFCSTSSSGASKGTGTGASAAGAEQTAQKPLRHAAMSARGPITYLSLGIAGAALGAILMFYKSEKEKKTQRTASVIKTTGKAAMGGPWVLVDQNGIPRTDASYSGQGKFQLLYFGFTFCPDICPSELVKIGKVLDILDNKGIDLTPLFVSVDPARDTVQQLKNYSQDFHDKMQYLTGTKDQVAAASKAYRVYFSKVDENENDDTDYLVDHSIVFYLLDPNGEFVDFFTQRMQVSDMVEKVVNAKADWDKLKKA